MYHDRWNVKVFPNVRLATKRLRLFIIWQLPFGFGQRTFRTASWESERLFVCGWQVPSHLLLPYTLCRGTQLTPPSKSPPQWPGLESHPCVVCSLVCSVVCRCCVKSLSSRSYKHLGSLIQTSNQGCYQRHLFWCSLKSRQSGAPLSMPTADRWFSSHVVFLPSSFTLVGHSLHTPYFWKIQLRCWPGKRKGMALLLRLIILPRQLLNSWACWQSTPAAPEEGCK